MMSLNLSPYGKNIEKVLSVVWYGKNMALLEEQIISTWTKKKNRCKSKFTFLMVKQCSNKYTLNNHGSNLTILLLNNHIEVYPSNRFTSIIM